MFTHSNVEEEKSSGKAKGYWLEGFGPDIILAINAANNIFHFDWGGDCQTTSVSPAAPDFVNFW